MAISIETLKAMDCDHQGIELTDGEQQLIRPEIESYMVQAGEPIGEPMYGSLKVLHQSLGFLPSGALWLHHDSPTLPFFRV